jgi:phosphatidylserine decarboxylase
LTAIIVIIAVLTVTLAGYLYWRYIWFFRNPPRVAPPGDNFVSPADGTVVYVSMVKPQEEVITIKKGVSVSVTDIVREDLQAPKVLIGIFMSPFSIHYNRVPLAGKVEFIRHHPPVFKNYCMGSMHWRTVLKCPPFHKNSTHIVSNERTVTKFTGVFKGRQLPYYVVQIAGKSVRGIESFFGPGDQLSKGKTFGMIRIGSQVDVVIPFNPEMTVMVRPGDKIRAGESILIS